MKMTMTLCLLLAFSLTALAQDPPPGARKFFPYPYQINRLDNGLRVVTVPTDHPNLVALYIVVQTGSRNEIEPGKSGFAHLFEHMMFRGSENYSPEQRDGILKRAGAESNAYTTDDRTVYHELFAKEDLEAVLKLEADRFQRLKYTPDLYKTETLAVLGEYNKNSADPANKLYEVLRETAFKAHTYGHTTMGFIRDIENMPNLYDYSLEFYRRYYRPEYTTITMVGDVAPAAALKLAEKYFGAWKKGDYVPAIPPEPPQKEPRKAHVDWPSPSLPYVVVAFRGPAYSDEKPDKAALDFLVPIAFGENSELYQRLVLREQKVDQLSANFENQMDPELFAVFARVKKPEDVEYVRRQIQETFKKHTTELIPLAKLNETRSRMRYETALGLNSSKAIAGYLASYISLRGTPETIEKLFALYQKVTPEQIREIAAKYFTESNMTVATLASKGKEKQ